MVAKQAKLMFEAKEQLRNTPPAARAPLLPLHCAEHGSHGPTVHGVSSQSCALHGCAATTPKVAKGPQAAISWSKEEGARGS
jgi:hypothetical protein